jgi:hypothetical protein
VTCTDFVHRFTDIQGPDGVGRLCLQLKQEVENAQYLDDWPGEQSSARLRYLSSRGMVRADGKVFTNLNDTPLIDGQVGNQIQYVNKMLRRETKGLGIRQNSIVFTGVKDRDVGVYRQLISFLKQLPVPQHKHLATIVLKDRGAFESHSHLEDISNFCRINPHVHIKLHRFDARPLELAFVDAALRVKQVFRKDPSFVTKITSNLSLQHDLLMDNQATASLLPPVAANLRFFPTDADDGLDEVAFRRACASNDEFWEFAENTITGGIDAWMPWIREWYQDGF